MDKNGVPYILLHIPHTTRKRRPGTIRQPRTLTIHSTGNPTSTARGERGWLVNPSNTGEFTGWHVCVDDKEAVEAIPPNEVAWHAGDGATGQGNMYSIGLEICESGNRAQTLLNAAKVAASLLREHGLTPESIKQHYDWNGKNCPRILREGNRWQEFVSSVWAWYNYEEPRPPEIIPEVPIEEFVEVVTPENPTPAVPPKPGSKPDWSDAGLRNKRR